MQGTVRLYEAPNVLALNFVCTRALGGGGPTTLRADVLGKTLGLNVLRMEMDMPDRPGWSKTAIAERLAMSRNTVDRLLRLAEPPKYHRAKGGSALDEYHDAIGAMLEENPKAPATVILERLRPSAMAGGSPC